MKLVERIRYIYHCCQVYRSIKTRIVDFVSLEPGWYFITGNARYYIYRGKTPVAFLEMIGIDRSKPSLICCYVRKKNGVNSYTSQVIMTTNDGIRYFDYKRQETLHTFSNLHEFEMYNQTCSRLVPPFKTTVLRMEQRYCIEKIIDHTPRNKWGMADTILNFYRLFNRYIEYLNNAKTEKVCIEDKLRQMRKPAESFSKIYQSLCQGIKPYNQTRYVFSHGDLHFENVIFDKKDIYVLDFEMVGWNVFFYDIFNLLYVEYIDKNNETLLDSYLSKDNIMMNHFSRLFESVGEEFNPVYVCNYLKLFLLERLVRSVLNFEDGYDVEKKAERIKRNISKVNRLLNKIKENEI